MHARHDFSQAGSRSEDTNDVVDFAETVGGSLQAAFASLDAANTSSSSYNSSDWSDQAAVPTAAQRQQHKTRQHARLLVSASDGASQWNSSAMLPRAESSSAHDPRRFDTSRTDEEGLARQRSCHHRKARLSAKRRQDAPPSESRALAGGRSMREMREQAQNQWQRHSVAQKQAQREICVKDQAPPAAQVENNRAASGLLHLLNDERPPPPSDNGVSISQPSTATSNSDAASRRRTPVRSMSWSAKRDKRDARRRPSPPLTRRRAQAKGMALSSSLAVDAASPRSTPSAVEKRSGGLLPAFTPNLTCDITDLSNDDLCSTAEYAVLTKAHEEIGGRRKALKKAYKPVRPALDLTLTEPVQRSAAAAAAEHVAQDSNRASTPASVAVDHAGYSSDTQASSQTQSSQPDRTNLLSLAADDVVLDAGRLDVVPSSDTENEGNDAVPHRGKAKDSERFLSELTAAQQPSRLLPKTWTKKATKKRRSGDDGGQRISKAALATAAVTKVPSRTTATATRRRGPVLPRGAPLFDGFHFILLGFYTRVKIFEKLVAKHSGSLATRPQDQSCALDDPLHGVTHVIYCPHAAFKPDRVRVSQAVLDWCGGRPEHAESLLQACSTSNNASGSSDGVALLDANWISDCIAACMLQDELLSLEKYRIII